MALLSLKAQSHVTHVPMTRVSPAASDYPVAATRAPRPAVTKVAPFPVSTIRRTKGKRVRLNITSQQLVVLEKVFAFDQFPNFDLRTNLGEQLSMTPRRVQIWFQNKRAKLKKESEDATVSDATVSDVPESPLKSSKTSLEDDSNDEQRGDTHSDSEFSPL